jgi:hypothetical protein
MSFAGRIKKPNNLLAQSKIKISLTDFDFVVMFSVKKIENCDFCFFCQIL